MLKLFRNFKELLRFNELPKSQKQLVFYSEGKNYWPHLSGIVEAILNETNNTICYITSDIDDPGLKYEHPNLKCFVTDEGEIRNWLFNNLQASVVVMTMPDLHHHQVKRSIYDTHYVYVQHSLVSLHMVYRKGAFDYFDTILCCGEHHIKEIRAMEKQDNLPVKNLVKHGYSRLDQLLKDISLKNKKEQSYPKRVLIAPSWGENCIIETVGVQVVDTLITAGFNVTLRPHPQTVKFSPNTIKEILEKHENNKNFVYENNIAGSDSLYNSDIMVSDWSGAALDYALSYKKPVLFIDVPKKVNNSDYEALGITPLEDSIRNKIGKVIALDEIMKMGEFINAMTEDYTSDVNVDELVFNVGNSDKVACEAIVEILKKKNHRN